MENRDSFVCKLCVKEKSKYTCPRCNVQYCSLECYKSEKHLRCSELFYKDCFMEGLKEFSTSKEDKHKILEMLQRVEDGDTGIDSDDDGDDLEERLQGLDLGEPIATDRSLINSFLSSICTSANSRDQDTKAVWDILTEKEKKEFERLASGGELSNLVEIWTPWWNDKNLVTEIDDKCKKQKKQPDVQENIPDISSLLTKGKPSSDIRHNVINVLYSYCFICRLYNGEHMTFPTESTKEILFTSKVLSDNVVCGSPGEAIQLCIQCLQNRNKENLTTQQFNISIIEDIISIIKGPSQHNPLQYVLAALSELVLLLQKSVTELSKDIKKCKDEKMKIEFKSMKKKIFYSEKKIEFLLSWSHRFGMALSSTATELQLELCALSSDLADVNTTKQKIEKYKLQKDNEDKKQLIQELLIRQILKRHWIELR